MNGYDAGRGESKWASAEHILRDNGIDLPNTALGRYYTTCPKCSPRRSTAEHRKAKVLGVTIDHEGVTFGCNHCNWTGGRSYKANGHARGGGPAATYDYDDANGKLVFQKVRNPADSKNRFWCRQPNGRGGWINNTKGIKRKPLYRWPEIVEAMAQGKEIAVAEGEKDCDNLWRIGIPATCNFDGAADVTKDPNAKPKWKLEYSEQLANARLIVFNDNDPQGYAHADAVCRMSIGVAKRVRRLDLKPHWPEIPEHGDVSDWLTKGGGTRGRLAELMATAPAYDGGASNETSLVDNNTGGLQWRGWTKDGSPARSMHNAMVGLDKVGVTCASDLFHNKILIGYHGEAVELQRVVGEVTDTAVIALRKILSDRFGTDFGTHVVRDAIVCLADQHRFDPVCDMLDQAQAAWDGTARLDTMVSEYASCANTPLNRAIMRKTMIAAVRRARQPGCKFDNITVLESEEGWNKSTFWRVLAGDENFSDESILGARGKEVQEQLTAIWIHESADLAGMRKAEVETVKAFASRQVDIARPAYGYFVKKQPRHAINVGTTNADTYLQSQTGNRRFWPLKVLKPIDIEKLKRSRLQLWGEAAKREAEGESVTLPPELWDKAAAEQEKRRVRDPWEQVLCDIPKTLSVSTGAYSERTVTIIHRDHDKEEDFVASADLLEHVLGIPPGRQEVRDAMRLATVMMKRFGWEDGGNPRTIGDRRLRGYVRPIEKDKLL
jgi:Virulence-associated protein E